MRKKEFFEELRRGITNMPKGQLDEILEDFNEHFEAGLEDGLTEEEICRNLGQPGTIAEEIMGEFWARGANETRSAESGEAEIDKTFTGVKEIHVDMATSDVFFVREQRNDVRVTIAGNTQKRYELSCKQGRLEVWQEQLTKSFSISIFSFFGKRRQEDIAQTTLYLPMDFEGPIDASTAVGKMVSRELSSPIKFSTSAGSITVEGSRSPRAALNSGAGSITAELFGKAAVKIDTGAGSVTLMAEETTEMKIDSGAGSVKAEVGKICGTSKLTTGAGSVSLTARNVEGDIKLSSGAGSIKAYLPEDADIRIKMSSGMGSSKSEIGGNRDSKYTLKADAGIGSIRIKRLQGQ